MKKLNFLAKLFLAFSIIMLPVGCNNDELITNENQTNFKTEDLTNLQNREPEEYYLSYDDALTIAKKLVDNAKANFEKLEHNGQEVDDLENEFWRNNQDLLSLYSEYIGLEVDFVPENFEQFKDVEVDEQKINDSKFLTPLQKQYALDLFNAVESKDLDALFLIKDRFKIDVKNNSALGIFNGGIAFIEVVESEMATGGIGDCWEAFLTGAVMGGVYGMISGAITGGISGAVIGSVVTGFIASVPAGGAGATVGSIFGAITGFLTGGLLGLLGCLIFG